VSRQQQRVSPQVQSSQSRSNGQLKTDEPDPEVVLLRRRRRFSVAYKQRILEEADRCSASGELGALLRREGLYSSHLTRWRAQRRAGQLEPQNRGRQPDLQAAELKRLQRENQRLKAQLERAELIMDAQKKLCQLLNLPSFPEDESA
jgi:transposase-like protein